MIGAEQLDTFIAGFNAELQAKGYRGNFTLVINDPAFTEFKGNLYDCLKGFAEAYRNSAGMEDSFRLYTFGYYRRDNNYIYCGFEVTASEAFGLRVSKLTLEDGASGKTIAQRLHNNAQIPARDKLKKKFPQPTLWQKLRGKRFTW